MAFMKPFCTLGGSLAFGELLVVCVAAAAWICDFWFLLMLFKHESFISLEYDKFLDRVAALHVWKILTDDVIAAFVFGHTCCCLMATQVSWTVAIIFAFGIVSLCNSAPINTETYKVSSQSQTASSITLGLTKSGTWTIYGTDISSLTVFVTPETSTNFVINFSKESIHFLFLFQLLDCMFVSQMRATHVGKYRNGSCLGLKVIVVSPWRNANCNLVTPRIHSLLPYPEVSDKHQFRLIYFFFCQLVLPALTKEVIFNTTSDGSFNGLVFENQYLEISTQLEANANIYGFGEEVKNT